MHAKSGGKIRIPPALSERARLANIDAFTG
jgi:hypothetical protein